MQTKPNQNEPITNGVTKKGQKSNLWSRVAVVLSTTEVLTGDAPTEAKPQPLRLREQTCWERLDGRPAKMDYKDNRCALGPGDPERDSSHAEHPRVPRYAPL